MNFRFKLTVGFLVISVAIFVIAAMVITQSSRRNEEANLIEIVSEQSSRDAQVIAGVVSGYALTGGTASEFTSPGDSSMGFGNLAITTFLQSSNIVGLSLFDADGFLLWSSQPETSPRTSSIDASFSAVMNGDIVTALNRNVEFISFDGASSTGDVTSTLIPLLDVSTQRPTQVLEVAREVTGTLDARIDSARSSMFRTVFSTLGGSFVVLFGVVLTADLLIGRSRTRAVSQERALADEKVAARGLELENQQLRQMNEERDRFLSMVSHELRTPLTTIMGFTDVLRKRQDGERKETNVKHLDMMRRNGDHLNSLIEEMLEITRIESGKFEVVKDGFAMGRLLEQVSESARMLLKPRGQTLLIDSDVDDVELHGDRRRVMQVLLNLLSNASKYSPANTTIRLGVRQRGDSVEISVGDEGEGISEDERKLLFERFYRSDNEATRSQSGLGLGLSIVKAIVDAHHGSIEVDSQLGEGTVMTVMIPGARLMGAPAVIPVSKEQQVELDHLEKVRDLRAVPIAAKAS